MRFHNTLKITHKIVLGSVLFCGLALVLVILPTSNAGTFAQDPTSIPLSPEQLNLLSEIDAADLDQGNWQTYSAVSYNNLFYSESLQLAPDSTLSAQRATDTLYTTQFQGNPLNPIYSSNTLMTIENRETSLFDIEQQLEDSYTLTVEARYIDGHLYVQALRDGGSETLVEMPPFGWHDVTDNPDQFEALQAANLSQFMPDPPSPLNPHPLFNTDFFALTRGSALRDLVADIELVNPSETITEGPLAGLVVRQIRIQLNPLAMLENAFASFENSDGLVAAFANEGVDMSLTVWLDASTSRRVREQFVLVVQGQPDPAVFGYPASEIGEDATLSIIYQLESDISYTDINAPVDIQPPLLEQ